MEPNKQYVYRVCLALGNPNQGVKPAFLKKPELAKETYLKTKWSEPSPVIAVPRDTRILLVSVKPPRAGGEPTGEILITKWVEQTGVEVFIKESPIVRGQVLNFPDRTGKTIGGSAARQPDTRRGLMGGPMGLEMLGGRPPAFLRSRRRQLEQGKTSTAMRPPSTSASANAIPAGKRAIRLPPAKS